MATETRKFTPQEIKDRRLKAAEANVETAAKNLERAEKRVTDAKALVEKRDQARLALTKAEKHRDWIKSMPVDEDGDEGQEPEAPAPAEDEAETGEAEEA